jgi:hypothetical protein
MVKCDGINYGFDEEIDWGYCSAGGGGGERKKRRLKNRCRLDDSCEWVPVVQKCISFIFDFHFPF